MCKNANIKHPKAESADKLRRRLLEHHNFCQEKAKDNSDDQPQGVSTLFDAFKVDIKLMLDQRFESLQGQVACLPAIKQASDVLSNTVAGLATEISQLKEDNSMMRARLVTLEQGHNQSTGIGMAVEDLETRFAGVVATAAAAAATTVAAGAKADASEQQDIEGRKADLRLTNVPGCNSQAEADVPVPELLATLAPGLTTTSVQYFKPKPSYASAVAANTGDRPRSGTVVVKLASAQEKGTVLRSLKKLQGTKFHHTHVDINLTQRQANARKAQQAIFQKLRQEGKRPQWRGAKLWVDRQLYQPPQSLLRAPP